MQVTAVSGVLLLPRSHRRPIQVRLDKRLPKRGYVVGSMAVMNRQFEVEELDPESDYIETLDEMRDMFQKGYTTIGVVCYGPRNVVFVADEGWTRSLDMWEQVTLSVE